MKQVIEDLKIQFKSPMKLFCNNKLIMLLESKNQITDTTVIILLSKQPCTATYQKKSLPSCFQVSTPLCHPFSMSRNSLLRHPSGVFRISSAIIHSLPVDISILLKACCVHSLCVIQCFSPHLVVIQSVVPSRVRLIFETTIATFPILSKRKIKFIQNNFFNILIIK